MSFTVRTDRRLIRAAERSDRYVLCRVQAPLSPRSRERTPVSVALVLDRSGSMGGLKIALAKEAAARALRVLDERDRFALVVYDDRIDVVVESTPASEESRRNALQRLREIDARGMTNLAEGWLRGAEQLALHLNENVLSCLLLTDGLANEGITDPAELERHSAELRGRGIATSTFGVGADFDEVLLQAMAVAGGGHFYFIERPVQIPDLIASELGEVLDVVARNAAIEVRVPEGVLVEPFSALQRESVEGGARIALGDVVSGQELDVVLRLSFPAGEIGHRVVASFTVTDRDSALAGAPQNVSWEYADDMANEGQPRDRSVDRLVATLYAARVRQEAVALNRNGDFDGAARVMDGAASSIRAYAASDPDLNRIADELAVEKGEFGVVMEPMELKRRYFTSSTVARMRTAEGRARREPKA